MSEFQETLQLYQDFAKKNPAAFQLKVNIALKNIVTLQIATVLKDYPWG